MFSLRSFSLVCALAIPLAAHADTYTGTVSFTDTDNPNSNDALFSGSFASPSFSFTGVNGTLFTDTLTIIADTSQGGNGQISGNDVLTVQLTFTAPSASGGSLTGSGTISGHTDSASGTITWTDSTITFSDGSSVLAHLPNFSFSNADIRGDGKATLAGDLDLTVTIPQTGPLGSVPEPSSIALLGTGLLGAAGAVRRKLRS